MHWEAANGRFFCPCHNGAFDSSGAPTAGPPLAAQQHLPQYALRVEGELLLIGLPESLIVAAPDARLARRRHASAAAAPPEAQA